jgi:hypothetical protein
MYMYILSPHTFFFFFDKPNGSHMTGPMLDALILIAANTEFTNWVFKKISVLKHHWSPQKRGKKETDSEDECGGEPIEFASISTGIAV